MCAMHWGRMTGWALLAVVALAGAHASSGFADEAVIAIKVARIYPVAGDPIDGGVVLIREGRIAAVGADVAVPGDARVFAFDDAVLTPGLIDACCAIDFEIPQTSGRRLFGGPQAGLWTRLGMRAKVEHQHAHLCDGDCGGTPGNPSHGTPGHVCCPICGSPPDAHTAYALGQHPSLTWAEHSSEVIPHRLVIDGVNLLANDFKRLLRDGVTTVYITPDSASVIGARGAIVRTGGPLSERIVRGADAVKVSLGSDPSRRGVANVLPPYYGPAPTVLTRRPTTRMGVDWVFRKAFYDALRTRQGIPIYGADMPPAEAIPVLLQVLDGEIPLRIQARMQHDIFSALRLAQEFELRFTLEEATEAYRCIPQLQAAGLPVIFGPLYMDAKGFRSFVGETDRPRLNTPRQLADAGIPFALTAQELRDEEGLARQAMIAVRNGLPAEHALRAVTCEPARLLGLPETAGTVQPGAPADLVIWSREPFDAASRPVMVLIGGRVVLAD